MLFVALRIPPVAKLMRVMQTFSNVARLQACEIHAVCLPLYFHPKMLYK
jgi:hypothetical protein